MAKYLKVKKVILRKSTFSFLIIIFGLLSIIMFLLTLYGSSSGNFMITTDADAEEKGIILSTTADFADPRPLLFATSLKNVEDMTYGNLQFDKIIEAEGDFVDPFHTYLAFTFYVKNNGQETVDIEYYLIIQEAYRNTEEAIRFVLIEDGSYIRLFQKPDLINNEYENYGNREPDETHEFTSEEVFRYLISDFKPDEIKKFSIIIYLEGQDPDCNDDILGGSLKSTLQFSIVESE